MKVLDDLADEGYTALNTQMEADFSCITRLRHLILRAGDKPFAIAHKQLPQTTYSAEEYDLFTVTNRLIQETGRIPVASGNPFLRKVRSYCEWIGYDGDTAYVFLFRDALLPYICFRCKNREHLYPWLISRNFIADLTGANNVDDLLRLPIYEALENGYTDFPGFSECCKDRILTVLKNYPELKEALQFLLRSVREGHIVVVESGYCGTVPMVLSALDERVTFRMYTTAPFLYETYQEQIFCRKYEDIRSFETIYSQDILLQYASYKSGRFYVRTAENKDVVQESLSEIRCFL